MDPKEINRLIGMRLKQLRKSKRVSQAEAARVAQVDQKSIQRIENGEHGMSLETAVRLARYYGTSVEELVEGFVAAPEAEVKTAGNSLIAAMRQVKPAAVVDAMQELLERVLEMPLVESDKEASARPPSSSPPDGSTPRARRQQQTDGAGRRKR